MFQQNIYDTNYGIQSMETCDLNMQSKYLLMQQDAALPGNNLLDRAVEQLNDPDADLLNLLATEEDCTSILQNIASNEQFESLINNDSDFHTENLQNFMDPSYCEKIPYIPNIEHNLLETIPSSEISAENPSIKPIGEFKCAQCDKPCTSKKMLRYHLKTHSDVRPYACEICNKRFRQKYEVTAHKRSHTNPSFQCDICSKMFVHKSHLTSHRRKHVGDFDAFCEDCNKGFITKSAYQNHIKIHHEKLLHICDICGQQLSTLSSLNEHKNIHDRYYGKDRTHICDICGKSYLTARNLKTHLKTHMQLSTYVCNICGKSLSSKKVLETHVKMHIGEKDFVCQYCNKSFAAKEYLTTHIRTHTGDKPYSCHICDKSFTQRTTLTVHLRYHTGERPYKCHCGKGYITKSHLISHYKTHEIPNIDFGYDLPS